MEVKVNSKETMISIKEEDEMKKIKETVVIGQKTEDEEISKGKETMKIKECLKQNQDETRQDDSKNDSRSSSSSLEMIMAKFDNDKTSSKIAESNKKEEDNTKKKTSSHVWDCGSSLYDSFELNSFRRQLDSAISASSARTMSMSRLPDRRLPPTPQPPPPPETSKRHSNKISRSLQRFLKSVFRPKQQQSSSSSSTPSSPDVYNDRYYVVYDKSGSLTTIPESTEKEVGPEINSLVRKTVSERFPASRVVGISCA